MHRALRIVQILLGFLLAALIVAHAVVLLVATLPRFVFWTMGILTLFWCSNLIYGFVIFAQVQMARRHKVTLPETMVKFPTEGPHVAGALVFATAGAFLTGTALFSYLRSLSTISPNAWVLEFNAAMQLLAVLLLAVFLFGRVVASAEPVNKNETAGL